jgi:hypothetical protein
VLKRLLVLLAIASVLSSCGTTGEDKEIEVAIEKACKTVININGGVSVSGGAGGAFAELARLDARYLPLLVSFSDWWQSQPRAIDTQGPPKYPPFPDALRNFCKA